MKEQERSRQFVADKIQEIERFENPAVMAFFAELQKAVDEVDWGKVKVPPLHN